MSNFYYELQLLINKFSMENDSNTPDFILVNYLRRCLENFDTTIEEREKWYGRNNELRSTTCLGDLNDE